MANHRSERNEIAGTILALAAIIIVASVISAQLRYPGYNLENNYISDLGVGSTAPIFNTAMVIFGLLVVSASVFLHIARYRHVALAITLIGIGGIGVGVFPETTGIYHIISATVTFLSAAVAALFFYRIYEKPLAYYSLVAGLVGVSVVILFVVNLALGTSFTFGIGKGGIEEILFYNEIIWAFVAGYKISGYRY
ncbi:MAG: DUF998 domain-containing protein [Candidatus Micrarchaeota archaeon]|nr:DUF998 domain-containing protein [Candidatus Micrarchaeota archaeon]